MRHILRQRQVNVQRTPPQRVRSKLQVSPYKLVRHSLLRLLVHHAARRSATELHARRPLQHVDRLVVERVPVVGPKVPDPIHVNVVARVEPANCQAVALRPTLTRRQRDARHIPQPVPQGRRRLLLQNVLRHHRHCLRRVRQALRKSAQRNRVRRCRHTHLLRIYDQYLDSRPAMLKVESQPRPVQDLFQRRRIRQRPAHCLSTGTPPPFPATG